MQFKDYDEKAIAAKLKQVEHILGGTFRIEKL